MDKQQIEIIERESKIRNGVRRTLRYLFLIFWAILVLFPFYWMILTSVKSYGAYNSEYAPKFFTLRNIIVLH